MPDPVHTPAREKYEPEDIIEALRQASGFIKFAAMRLGCSRQTITRYIDKYPEVKAAYDEVNENVKDEMEGRLLKLCRGQAVFTCPHCKKKSDMSDHPDVRREQGRSIQFYARTKMRDRGYGDQLDVVVQDIPQMIIYRRGDRPPELPSPDVIDVELEEDDDE